MQWLYLGYLGFIPITWWTTNKIRACASKWRANRNYKRIKESHEVREIPNPAVREVPEVQTYCAGCDEVVPESWMAWVDADNDGEPDAAYRCRVCRGVPEPVEREDPPGWERSILQGRHETSCQCSNCHPEQLEPWTTGPGSIVHFEDNRGDDLADPPTPYEEMTPAQIENLRNAAEIAGVDLSELLANFTDAVEVYRDAGIDATNETDERYRARLRRRAELREKYRMDEPPKPREGHWEWNGMGREWIDATGPN